VRTSRRTTSQKEIAPRPYPIIKGEPNDFVRRKEEAPDGIALAN
jgi:hypothetical protein